MPGHPVAVEQQVVHGLEADEVDVHLQAVEQLLGVGARDLPLLRHLAEPGEDGVAQGLAAVHGVELGAQAHEGRGAASGPARSTASSQRRHQA